MATKKITELTELAVASDEDLIPIVDVSDGETKKIQAKRIGAGGIAGDTVPIGTIMPYSGNEEPVNWIACDGRELNRSEYENLFAIIGTTYGEGDGSTTFNIPNLKRKIPVGFDSEDEDFNAVGKTGGEKTHTLTIEEMPKHRHGIRTSNGSGGQVDNMPWGAALATQTTNTEYTGGGQAHNNMPPYIVTKYIIKAFQSAGVVADVEQDLSSNSTINVPSVKAINDNLKTEYILVTISLSQTISSNYVINFNSVVDSYGDKLSLQNGKIVIGAGVNKIKVGGSLFAENFPSQVPYVWGIIKKNSNEITTSINGTNGSYLSASVSPTIENVQQGDIISFLADSPNGGRLRAGRANTFMLVEVVH